MQPPTMLVILDGFGYTSNREGNAIAHAHMPMWHKLVNSYPHVLLHASGESVGLLPGYMGNSEVGHLALGAGRIVKSMLKRFHDAIDDGSFFTNKILLERFAKLKENGGALHLMGLLSDGGVHSHEYHLHALIKLAKQCGLEKIYIHAFLDGRDVSPRSAATYLQRLDDVYRIVGCGVTASIHGRFYAMDRDKNWGRTALSYRCLVGAEESTAPISWSEVLGHAYAQGVNDEFVVPVLMVPEGSIKRDDGIVFFNFRPDRAQQLTECFINPNFSEFIPDDLCSTTNSLTFFVTTSLYKEAFTAFKNDVLFKRELVMHTLLDEIATQVYPLGEVPEGTAGNNKINSHKVFIIAETEKYAHVTYFFRGMVDKQLPHEERVLVPSVKMKGYADYPQMSAPLITQYVMHSLEKDPAYFYLINYANADMVGHSGDFKATVQACQVIDQQLEQLYHVVVEQLGGTMFIVGDHGNAEEKIDKIGQPRTAHTTNPVPFVMVNKAHRCGADGNGELEFTPPMHGLTSVAPTILKHLGLTVPDVMEQKKVF